MKKLFKIYKDGSHFVATEKGLSTKKSQTKKDKSEMDLYFDELYFDAVITQKLKNGELRYFLVNSMLEKYPDIKDVYAYVEEHIKRKIHNFYSRMKRFKRKASLNKWNYFVTITFDNKKMDAITFKRKLRKCLSNLHCRRNWRYMGVFELSPTENRLHFHALMYIPKNEMLGEIVEQKDYSTKQHKMQITHSNTFFADTFGRNDFAEITEDDIKFGHTDTYLTKYLSKTGDKIVYSRGIPTEIERYIDTRDVATDYEDFCVKFVLFDGVIDSDLQYNPYYLNENDYYQTSLAFGT